MLLANPRRHCGTEQTQGSLRGGGKALPWDVNSDLSASGRNSPSVQLSVEKGREELLPDPYSELLVGTTVLVHLTVLDSEDFYPPPSQTWDSTCLVCMAHLEHHDALSTILAAGWLWQGEKSPGKGKWQDPWHSTRIPRGERLAEEKVCF